MKPERWQQIEQLYEAALAREVSQRAAFLAAACSNDEALRQEVESLLSHHARSGGLIDQPALKAAAKWLAPSLPSLVESESCQCTSLVLALFNLHGPL